MGFLKKIGRSIKKTIKDPKRLIGAMTGNAIAGIPGAIVGSGLMKKPGAPGASADPTQGSRDFAQMQLQRAQQFEDQMPNYISGQAQSLRRGISQQLADTRGQIQGGANARGMLFSGQRMKQEGRASESAGQQYAQGLSDIVRQSEQELLGMQADPMRSIANVNEAGMQQQSELARAQEARRAAAAQMTGQYAGMIGSGIGRYYGGKD